LSSKPPARKMFGEYGLYCDGKMVAVIGDDQLFVKQTPGGRVHAGAVAEVSPYPGAKLCLLIPGDRWEDADWLAGLIRVTAAELVVGKKKRA
jgi:TfoX/Sxy family transcriptional regulator of competence genes